VSQRVVVDRRLPRVRLALLVINYSVERKSRSVNKSLEFDVVSFFDSSSSATIDFC
jgi:hypothetical protein